MKNATLLLLIILLLSTSLLTSCDNDAEDTPPVSELVGTWAYLSADLTLRINDRPIRTFLTQTLGLDLLTSILVESLIKEAFERDELKSSTMTFNIDGTYTSKNAAGTETSGTYVLNPAKTLLTLTNSGETYAVNVLELNNTRLKFEAEEKVQQDLNGDGQSENIDINLIATFIKQ